MAQAHIRKLAGFPWWKRLWYRVHEPKVVAIFQAAIYLVLMGAGVYALAEPPSTLEGAVGDLSMSLLSSMLIFGGVVGSWTALFGIQWLERYAVVAVFSSSVIYAVIIIALQISGTGNRLMQLGFICAVMLSQPIRWARLRNAPYDRRITIGS